MTKEELERIRFVAKKYLEMVDSLSDEKLDFSQVNFDDDVMKYISGNRWILERQQIEEERTRQTNILNECMNMIKEQYPDFYCINYLTKIRDYRNYYLVHIYGSPFESASLVFDKKSCSVMICYHAEGSIDVIDENNFFLVKRDEFGNKTLAFHLQIADNGFKVANILSSVHTNVLPFGKNRDGNLVSWRGFADSVVHEEKKVLYNYKVAKIVVPEFTDAKYDYGNFSGILQEDLIRIINRIEYGDNCVELEFLIDEDGKLATDVMDFQNGIRYSIGNRGTDQMLLLDSIFYEANGRLEKKGQMYCKGKK